MSRLDQFRHEACAAIGLCAIVDPTTLEEYVLDDVTIDDGLSLAVRVPAERAAAMVFDADDVSWRVDPPDTIPYLVIVLFGETHTFSGVER